MSSKRSSFEKCHKRKYLVVIDDTEECDRAVYWAAKRAGRTKSQIVMLRVIETAERAGIYTSGYHTNQAKLAPKGYLTGAEWQWEKIYVDFVETMKKGGVPGNFVRGGLPDGFADGVDDVGWSLSGNAGTSSANFLGTTDNMPLVLRVGGGGGLRLEPNIYYQGLARFGLGIPTGIDLPGEGTGILRYSAIRLVRERLVEWLQATSDDALPKTRVLMVEGATVREVFQRLDGEYPGLKQQLLGDDGQTAALTHNLTELVGPYDYRYSIVGLNATNYNFLWSDYSANTNDHTSTFIQVGTGKDWTHGYQVPSSSTQSSYVPLDAWTVSKSN